MEAAKKTRKTARIWMTKAINAVDEVLAKEDAVMIDYEGILQQLTQRESNLNDAQLAVENHLDEAELEADIEEASQYVQRTLAARTSVMKKMSSLSEETESNSGSSASGLQTVKLPTLELPKFGGEVTEWQTFWDKFTATVDATELPEVTKFTYLQSLLVGEAQKAIQGLTLTSAHYGVACKLLEERFGRPEKIIFSHIQGLLTLTVEAAGSSLARLRTIQDQILVHVRSLDALDIKGATYGVFLTPLILSRLPTDVRMEWAREGGGKESDLPYLLDFLKKEIERRERAVAFSAMATEKRVEERKKPGHKKTSASALQTNSSPICGICNKTHFTGKCWTLLKLSIPERQQKIKDAQLCFKCLNPGHMVKSCSAKCTKCQGNHHRICCFNTQGSDSSKTESESRPSNANQISDTKEDKVVSESHVGVAGSVKSCLKQVVSQTANVRLLGPKGSTNVTVLFDSGSDRTYVSSKLVNKLGLKWVGSTELRYAVFGGGHSSTLLRNIYELNLEGVGRDLPKISLNAVEVPVICTPMSKPNISAATYSAFGNLRFAKQDDGGDLRIDILVGLDYYWQLVKQGLKRVPSSNLVALETVFGWVLSGSLEDRSHSLVSQQLLVLNDLSELTVRKFWDLDSIGIGPKDLIAPSDKVLEQFNDSIQFKDGRYEVALPWKQGSSLPRLLDNDKQARIRLKNLMRKLNNDPPLKARYDSALREMETNGVIQEIPSSEVASPHPVFYLPHRPVVREASSTTKVRPVFDASAKGPNNISLNDCLEAGPPLIPSLVEILLRFRRWKVALTADLTKAFLQIKLQRKDQDVHRFFWDDKGSVRIMRFLRVTFGNKASPFLLNATIRHHLSKYASSVVIKELNDNLYVDDWLSGADTEQEACEMFAEAKSVMSQAGMCLAKWNSNSKAIAEKMCSDDMGLPGEDEGVKVLGVKWTPASDSFSFGGVELPKDILVTKRLVLSFIARMFDPLGFLTPFIMTAKCLFQELWQIGLDWDEEVPAELQKSFMHWLAGLKLLRTWEIPRCYCPVPWCDFTSLELHAFGDASEKGYGSVVYLRFCHSDGTYTSSLVISKARVAPVKKVTLPRLELLGSLLAARLLDFVRTALKLPADITYKCWTDSTAALGWVKGNPHRWKQFVANRVSEIQTLTDPACWFHCPGQENPADLTTRGLDARDLVSSNLWLTGPPWLSKPEREFPRRSEKEFDEQLSLSVVSEEVLVNSSKIPPNKLFEVERWGTFLKAMRVVAWVLRFIANARCPKKQRNTDDFSYDELSVAKMLLFKQSQRQAFQEEFKLLKQGKTVSRGSALSKLTPFVDKDGLLRVKGRLQMSELSYEEKHPIILPKDHSSKLLVRFQHKLLKHAGVDVLLTSLRNSFWVIGLRRLAKTVKRECVPCQRQESKACGEVAAPIPELRVSQAPPFTVTGVDYAGPLFCLDFPGRKFYVCLFTCAVVRAIHLELTESLSTRDFILAFKRFSARRGLPSVIYSDNAKTFKGSRGPLQNHYGSVCPNWRYIAPRSPWWGGWWERLVRSVKGALRRSLGKACLTRAEMETTLHEVENCINSRPLTFVGDDIQSKSPLTPNHFLTARGSSFQGSVVEDPENVNSEGLSLREQECQGRLDKFWEIWRSDYLRYLPLPAAKFQHQNPLSVGSVVLIQEDNIPRLNWALGRVIKLFPGRDNKVRSVELHTAKGPIKRSIQRLHLLEYVDQSPRETNSESVEGMSKEQGSSGKEKDTEPSKSNSVQVNRTRRGREIKPVQRLEL